MGQGRARVSIVCLIIAAISVVGFEAKGLGAVSATTITTLAFLAAAVLLEVLR